MSSCSCGSGLASEVCCAPLLAGQSAATAEALMRSRYAAFVAGDIDYIVRTCSAKALEDFDRAETEPFIRETKWLGLEIHRVTDGGVNDQTGQVDFTFRFRHKGQDYAQREIAEFTRDGSLWLYEESEINPKAPPAQVAHIGRNDPCLCGSGKKHKKCCGS